MKVAATKILQNAKRNERPFSLMNLSSYYRRHIDGHALKTWMRLERARAFSMSLMQCKESDERAVRAGKNNFEQICRMQNAWKSVNGVDPVDYSVLSYEQREECKKRAGKKAYDEFWAIVDTIADNFAPQAPGALKSVEAIKLGFISAARGDAGPLNRPVRAKCRQRVR